MAYFQQINLLVTNLNKFVKLSKNKETQWVYRPDENIKKIIK